MNKTTRLKMIYCLSLVFTGLVTAILMTFAYDYLVSHFGHEDRFQIIFGIAGGLAGIIDIAGITAIAFNDPNI